MTPAYSENFSSKHRSNPMFFWRLLVMFTVASAFLFALEALVPTSHSVTPANSEQLFNQVLALPLASQHWHQFPSKATSERLRQFLLHQDFVDHDAALASLVAGLPEGIPGLSWASGMNLESFLRSTRRRLAYFVDIAYDDALPAELARVITSKDWEPYIRRHLDARYQVNKYKFGFAETTHLNTLEKQTAALLLELWNLGVRETDFIAHDVHDRYLRLQFPAPPALLGNHRADTVTFTFIQADITKPDSYPNLLRAVLSGGLALLYERAAFGLFCSSHNLLSSLVPGGVLMTDAQREIMGFEELPVPDSYWHEIRVWRRLYGHEEPFLPYERPTYGWRMRAFRKPLDSAA